MDIKSEARKRARQYCKSWTSVPEPTDWNTMDIDSKREYIAETIFVKEYDDRNSMKKLSDIIDSYEDSQDVWDLFEQTIVDEVYKYVMGLYF